MQTDSPKVSTETIYRQTLPYYLLTFPLFFLFHGFTDNFNFVSVGSMIYLLGVYLAVTALLTGIFLLLQKNLLKASLLTAYIFACHFFFGTVHDYMRQFIKNGFLTKFSVLSVLCLIGFVVLYWILRRKQQFYTLTRYLNLLFLLLITLDIFQLTRKVFFAPAPPHSLLTKIPDTASKPDVYIILLDGYAGQKELKDLFGFDNTLFLDSLRQRGFKVLSSSNSNYNYTPYSMASLLNMQYLDLSKTENLREKGNQYATERINRNVVVDFFERSGYRFDNYSIFKVAGRPAPSSEGFVPSNMVLLTANTFVTRFEQQILPNLSISKKWGSLAEKKAFAVHRYNEVVLESTEKVASTPRSQPRFVYAHLGMPHHPYYYNGAGTLRPYDSLSKLQLSDKQAYLDNLHYTNKRISALIDHILRHSTNDPIIAVLSDHGFRHYETEVKGNEYLYSNLISIRLPGKSTEQFTDSLTNVNFFPALLNTAFGQRIPFRADSSFYIRF